MRGCAIIVGLAATLAACADEYVVEVGSLELQSPPSLPATARVSEPFEITFHTGGDGCTEHDSTTVELAPDGATITPYDRRPIGVGCTKILKLIEHRAMLAFDTAGTKIVLDGDPSDATLTIDVR